MDRKSATGTSTTVCRKCFVCSKDIKTFHFLSPDESSFMLCRILEIPYWTNDLQRIKFEQVCYCRGCLDDILKLGENLEQFEKLEKQIAQDKHDMKIKLIKSYRNYQIRYCAGKKRTKPRGMLQELREEIVNELEIFLVQPTRRSSLRSSSGKRTTTATMTLPLLPSSPSRLPEVNYSSGKILHEGREEVKPSNSKSVSSSQNSKNFSRKRSTLSSPDSSGVTTRSRPPSRSAQKISKRKLPQGLHRIRQSSSSMSENESVSEDSILDKSSRASRGRGKLKTRSSGDGEIENVDETMSASTPIPVKIEEITRTSSGSSSKSRKLCHRQPKKCKECGKILSTHQNWRHHVRSVHLGYPKFRCSFCQVGFERPSDLKRHESTKHSVDKPFKCTTPNCPKEFKSKQYLNYHLKTHQFQVQIQIDPVERTPILLALPSTPAFTCKVCLTSFTYQNNLRRHERMKSCARVSHEN